LPIKVLRTAAMMDGIGDLELRHGARRASAYARAEPIIRCLEATIRRHRADTGRLDSFPDTRALVMACQASGLVAPRGGPVTHGTVLRALRLMGLR
jgi:hypothetical protein